MKSPATDIATILQNSGVGTIGIDIFVGSDQPPEPDEAIFIQRTGVTEPNSPNLAYEYPTVQTVVRSYKGGRQACDTKVEQVVNALHGVVDIEVNESKYVQIFILSGPIDMLQDQVMRPITSINFSTMRSPLIF